MNDRFVKMRLEAGTRDVCACRKIPDKPFGDRSHAGTGIKPLALERSSSNAVEISDLPEN